jgi:hypothetical protein
MMLTSSKELGWKAPLKVRSILIKESHLLVNLFGCTTNSDVIAKCWVLAQEPKKSGKLLLEGKMPQIRR